VIGLIARLTVGIEPESEPARRRTIPGRMWHVVVYPDAPSGAAACLATMNDPKPYTLPVTLIGCRDAIIIDDPYTSGD
jgi:hypothetical protein